MPESGTYGSVRGAFSNECPYRDKIAWHWDDDGEKLRNFAHASTPRSSRVGKIARRSAQP
jgi:hypothetical protein